MELSGKEIHSLITELKHFEDANFYDLSSNAIFVLCFNLRNLLSAFIPFEKTLDYIRIKNLSEEEYTIEFEKIMSNKVKVDLKTFEEKDLRGSTIPLDKISTLLKFIKGDE